MSLEPTLITPFVTGLDTDLQPWIAPPDSFTIADNIHVRHGFIEKRSGYRKLGHITKKDASQAITDVSNSNPAVVTVGSTAAWNNGDKVYIQGVSGIESATTNMSLVNNMAFTVANKTGTTFELLGLNTTTATVYSAGGTAYTLVDSTERVMGITRYIRSDGEKLLIVFGQTNINYYDPNFDSFIPVGGNYTLNGGQYDYIWWANWQSSGSPNRLYFTNSEPLASTSNGIGFYDYLLSATVATDVNKATRITPALNAVPRTLIGCQLLFSLQDRLVVLSTTELSGGVTTTHPQRARWCAAQNPNLWRDDVPGQGGFVDAATGDQIISARQLQNQIIVYFTDSIWSLSPTPDPALAFKWSKLNSIRAADGRMASIGYDRDVRALGVRGITASNGIENQRIDERIQRFTVNQINAEEFGKVFCERSYSEQRWWTLYPSLESSENDSALIYDDDSQAYTTYTIAMNCLGYGNFTEDFAFEDFTAANNLDIGFSQGGDNTFDDFVFQENSETLLGGNITGDVFVMETEAADNGSSIDIDLMSAAWNPYKEQGIACLMAYVDIYADTQPLTKATVEFYKDSDENPYRTQTIDFLPNLNFIASVDDVSKTSPALVNATQHGLVTGDKVFIYGVQGMEQINGGSSLSLPYTVTVIDENFITLDGINATAYSTYAGGGGLYKRQFYKTKIWKRAYSGAVGYEHRIRIISQGADRDLHIDSFKPYFSPRGNRTVN